MIDYCVVDVECSGATNGTVANPFTRDNKLCYFGLWDGSYSDWLLDIGTLPYGDVIPQINQRIKVVSLIVGFAIKFDLHWSWRYGVRSWFGKNLWDCQLAHFLITGQQHKYPSLNEVAAHYGLGQKLDVVKTEYWEKGIDTDQIPADIVREYLKQDVMLTQQVFLKQIEDLKDKPQLKKLVWWNCQDLATTWEIEKNGIKYDMERSIEIGDQLQNRINDIDSSLQAIVPDVAINWNSDRMVSAVLYGGCFQVDGKESFIFKYKDGTEKEKQRNCKIDVEFPRLIDPLKGTELAKEGFWSTSEPNLRRLKPKGKAKAIIDLILERSTLETKRNRYYHGFPNLYKQMGWEDNILHTQLNHVVAGTGRLSSINPNIQNLEELMRQCVITRFK